MKKEVMVDMTSGRIASQILRFAMPVLLGLVFQRIYNFARSEEHTSELQSHA